MIERLAWVTARAAWGMDEDEPLALSALARTATAVEVVAWDDPDVDWAGFDRAVLRSTWDYPERLEEFLAWLDRVGEVTEVANPPAMVRWNLDKRYLADLVAAGVPVVPTAYVPPGTAPRFPDGDLVVKPAVGAGSRDAASHAPDQRGLAEAHIARLHAAGATVLVQPLLSHVAREGEWPLVFVGGAFSHAASKRVELPRAAAIDGLFAPETSAEHTPSAQQLAVAQSAVDVVTARFGTPAYARIDLVRDDDGAFCVLEAELVEPSLFLPYGDGAAAERLAAALISDPAG
ncbi:MAG: ATP-grasp domain-containing protein [Cellulomonadaceae bacterium]